MQILDNEIFPLREVRIDLRVEARNGQVYSCYFILLLDEIKGQPIGEIGTAVQSSIYSALKHAANSACKLD